MSEIVVLTGLSGAGRSQAADTLEDLGWFVVDNLPAELVPKVVELARAPGSGYERIVLVVGGGEDQTRVLPVLRQLREDGVEMRVLFLDASTPVLVRRYKDTRRRHPRSVGSLTEAIEAERVDLALVKESADVQIDTSDLNVHQLRDRVTGLFAEPDSTGRMQTSVVSFGYKHGLPVDVDLVFDCRFLSNPHWVEELRPQTGLDQPVKDYVLGQDVSAEFLERVRGLLELLAPAYQAEGKSYLTVAVGCTGGRHRSVAMAEEISTILTDLGHLPRVSHRDLKR